MAIPIAYAAGSLASRFALWAAPHVGRLLFGSVPRTAATVIGADLAVNGGGATRSLLGSAFEWASEKGMEGAKNIVNDMIENPAEAAGVAAVALTATALLSGPLGGPLALIAGTALALYFKPEIGALIENWMADPLMEPQQATAPVPTQQGPAPAP